MIIDFPRIQRLKDKVMKSSGVFIDRRFLWTESYQETETEPWVIIRQAKALEKLLTRMTIDIDEDELIVGRHPKKIPSPKEKARLKEVAEYWQKRPVGAGMTGHMSVDTQKVLSLGFAGIKAHVEGKLQELDLSDPESIEKEVFYRAAIIVLNSVCIFAQRYADEAKRLATIEKNSTRKAELEKIASVCQQVPKHPARTFHEALQSSWFVHLLICVENGEGHAAFCPGRFDQYAYPYYKRDIDGGRITKVEAQELFECFFLKFNEFDPYSRVQVLMIGGQTPEGLDGSNELSYMCLDACAKLKVINPALALSWHSGTPDELLHKACEVIKLGMGFPAIFNDEVIIPGLLRAGVAIEDARHYINGACVEISPIGKTNPWVASYYHNLPKCLELALNNGIDPVTGNQAGVKTGDIDTFKSFNDLLLAYKKQVARSVWLNTVNVNRQQKLKALWSPYPFLSCLIGDCIENGKDITAGGARYNLTEPEGVGMPNVADSLAVIKKLVFEDKILSLSELKEILRANFEGHEQLRQSLINKAPKYGNDIDEVDMLAKDVAESFLMEVEKYRSTIGGRYYGGFLCWTVHADFGRRTGATPDGRKAFEVLADSVGPAQGRDIHGPTAVIKSVTKFDHIPALGGLVLNLKFQPSMFQGEEGINQLSELIKTYFSLGGFEVQINVVSRETLLDAKKYPENHRNLIVRVAGYSDYFTRLDPLLQDDVISRTEHAL